MNARPLVAVLILIAAATAPSIARQTTKATIEVHVTDPGGTDVSKAEVRLVPSLDPAAPETQTDDKGIFRLQLAPRGYALFVAAPGFKTYSSHIDVKDLTETQFFSVGLEMGYTGPIEVVPAEATFKLHISAYPYLGSTGKIGLEEIKSLPHISVTVHNPGSKVDERYSGVRISKIFEQIGAPTGRDLDALVRSKFLFAAGSGGDLAVISLAEIDPNLHLGEVIVADSLDGHPLDPSLGPLRLVISEDKSTARCLKHLTSIELKSAY